MITIEFTAILLGLASAIGWGVGDFSGGVAAKRTGEYLVVFIMNLFGVGVIAAAILIFGEQMPPPRDLLFAVLAGMSGAVGLAAFLRGLSQGDMASVAPLTAVISASIPVIFSLFTDGILAPLQMVGVAFAFLSIWMISSGGEANHFEWSDVRIPLMAGLGFGFFFILIGQANHNAVLWPVLASRSGSALLMAGFVTIKREWEIPPVTQWPILLATSVFDSAGNVFFVFAASIGRLDIAAIISSLYPALTVLLARFILKEGITRWQAIGLVTALAAVVLIAL